jgi:hypothetical protein
VRCETRWPTKCRDVAVWLHEGRRLCDACARVSFARSMCLHDVPRDRPYWRVEADGSSVRQPVEVAPWVPGMVAGRVSGWVAAAPTGLFDQGAA